MAKNPQQKQSQLSKKHQDRMHREKQQTRWIIIGSVAVLVLVIGLILYGILDQQVLRGLRTVATVNDEKVNVNEFRAYTKYYRYNLIRNAEQAYQILQFFGNDPQFASQLVNINGELETFRAGEKALDQMVDNILIRQEAARRNIVVSPEEVEQAMQEALRFYADGTPTPTPTRAVLPTSTLSPVQEKLIPPTATLVPTAVPTTTIVVTETTITEPNQTPAPTEPPTPAPTETPYTLEGYKASYATLVADLATTYEVPEDTLRFVIETGLFRDRLQKEVIGEVPCEQDQVWAQHILVPEQALAQIVYERVQAGEDWFKLAAEFSTDDSNKDQGGDLGWFGPGTMVGEFEDAAFALTEPGQVSQPVKTDFGYHIIRLVARDNRPLTSAECTRMKQQKFQDWLTELRAQSQVTIDEFWQEVVPLNPVLPEEIVSAVNALGGGLPEGFPSPTPPSTQP